MKARWLVKLLLVAIALLLLIGCSGTTPAAVATEAAGEVDADAEVSATAEVVPATYSVLSFPISGQVVEVLVKEGDVVEDGDMIARLDSTDLDIALIRAEAALRVAEANLALSKAGPRAEEVERARDQLSAATARVAAAVAERDALFSAPDENEVISAQARVEQAADAARSAQEGYDRIIDTINQPELWDDLEPGDRTPLDGEQNARMALELANLRLAAAQAELDRLLSGPDGDLVKIAEAKIWVAAARRDAAKAYLDLVMAGTTPEEIAVSEAEVQQRRAAVDSARAARDQAVLTTPFAGTISAVYVDTGEWVGAGEQVTLVADLRSLRVETTDLNELDIARIEVGSRAKVTFDALPSVSLEGAVVSIAPKSEEGAGVNYTVVIELPEVPDQMRWGMTAFVDIEAK